MISSIAMMLLGAASSSAAMTPGVMAFVKDHHLTRYSVALVDLDGDKRPEALIYAMSTITGGLQSDECGSGGCDLYVLSLTAAGYRQISDISITRPPIRVLPSITHGWHDLGIIVAGGGVINGYEARLRFDGQSYPTNPTVPPAVRLKTKIGRVVIANDPLSRDFLKTIVLAKQPFR